MSTQQDSLLAIGIMGGNSLDGADLVLTRFDRDGGMEDVCAHSVPMPRDLGSALRQVRSTINEAQGDMPKAVVLLESVRLNFFTETEAQYTEFIAGAVAALIQKAKADSKISGRYNLDAIDLIGSHGQTCAHLPPSIAKSRSAENGVTDTYTVQIGNGQRLADLTGITVVCDFRSDDLMHGGEAAPLAPLHHQHLAARTKAKGHFPIAFFNAGNTGNVSVISQKTGTQDACVLGWDAGPFNHFPDQLMRKERNLLCDQDGAIGAKGSVNPDLLALLFAGAVKTKEGENFLLRPLPKSSDPEWYTTLPELSGEAPVKGQALSFEDRLRTAEYFSSYVLAHTLSFIPQDVALPCCFALCGGGWKNPLCVEDFRRLLQGDVRAVVLPEHRELFKKLSDSIKASSQGKAPLIESSSFFGFDGTAMEARIFADAAVCRIKREAFTTPATTGARKEVVCGIIRFPQADAQCATPILRRWIDEFSSADATYDPPAVFDARWSRAVKGWQARIAAP